MSCANFYHRENLWLLEEFVCTYLPPLWKQEERTYFGMEKKKKSLFYVNTWFATKSFPNRPFYWGSEIGVYLLSKVFIYHWKLTPTCWSLLRLGRKLHETYMKYDFHFQIGTFSFSLPYFKHAVNLICW